MRGTNEQVQEMVRLATPKQVAMLQRLAKDSNTKIERPFESLRIDQASALIDELIEKVSRGPDQRPDMTKESKQSNQTMTVPKTAVRTVTRDDSYARSARFGMAFKLTYHKWTVRGEGYVQGVPEEKHDAFIQDVLRTYGLINEAARKAGVSA
jgi:hypothetical protein